MFVMHRAEFFTNDRLILIVTSARETKMFSTLLSSRLFRKLSLDVDEIFGEVGHGLRNWWLTFRHQSEKM